MCMGLLTHERTASGRVHKLVPVSASKEDRVPGARVKEHFPVCSLNTLTFQQGTIFTIQNPML